MESSQINAIINAAWTKTRAALVEKNLPPEVHDRACWAVGFYEAEISAQLLQLGQGRDLMAPLPALNLKVKG